MRSGRLTWTAWPANPLLTESTSPGGQQIWQSELVAIDDELRWFLEVGAPILVLSLWCELRDPRGPIGRRLRSTQLRVGYLTFGVIMHVGIEVLMEIGPYMYVTCGMYPAVLGPSVVRGLFDRVMRARDSTPL